ncbi:CPBP family intramembrane glutamic endopeptidase [Lacrimispora sp. 38-1]|uniref:CPBP family intramembrane glutamic endopeptidase n=1 Tax=Lacrimispora sp. 38-1 TaxID=3125778 RepID=UPI003CED4231
MSYDSQTNVKQWNKKEIRKNTGKLVRGVLIYELIMFVTIITDVTLKIIIYSRNVDFNVDKVLDKAVRSGTSSIISVFLGLIFLFVYFRKSDCRKLIFYTGEKMTGLSFLILLTVFMSAQAAFSILGGGMELGFNQFGYSILGEIEDASSNSSTVSMLLYASFIGPVSEEIIFRGFVMRGFEKYGARYAVVMSAVIFGLFHGNLIQSIFAGLVGLVLGYTAMKYSIKWAVLLHIINNFVFGDLLTRLLSGMNESLQSMVLYGIEGAFLAGTVVLMLMKKTEIREKMKGIKIDRGLLGVTFSSIWLLIFIAFQLFQGISGIEKLN